MLNGLPKPNFESIIGRIRNPLAGWGSSGSSPPEADALPEQEPPQEDLHVETETRGDADCETHLPFDLTELWRRVYDAIRKTRAKALTADQIETLAESYEALAPTDDPVPELDESFDQSFRMQQIEANRQTTAQFQELDRINQENRMSAAPVGEPGLPIWPLFKFVMIVAVAIAFATTLTAVALPMMGDPVIAGAVGLVLSVAISACLVLTLLDDHPDKSKKGNELALTVGVGLAFAVLRLHLGAALLETAAYLLLEVSLLGLLIPLGRRRRERNAEAARAAREHEPFLEFSDWLAYEMDCMSQDTAEHLVQLEVYDRRRAQDRAARAGFRERARNVARGAILEALEHNKADAEKPQHQVILERIRAIESKN